MTLILLAILAGFFNAVMDTLQFNFGGSVFASLNPQFWNPKESWVNKWEDPENEVEKFPLSSTVFVWMTDGWHLAQFFMLKCFFGMVVLYSPIFHPVVDFVLLHSVCTGSFEIFYKYIFPRRES